MYTLSQEQITKFQTHILDWYTVHKRDLPWRQTRDPYKILVSEMMSQQTQISRVVPKYVAWIERFPTVEDLAQASVRDVLVFWSGLGYNRRAVYLQRCAQVIVREYQGAFPKEENALLQLPGVGRYTARAILCFAFDMQVTVVDTNIKKIILTQFVKKDHLPEKDIETITSMLLPKGKAYEWNQALMDYAGMELKKEKIRVPKQSKFTGSNRFVRGTIIKILLKHQRVTQKQLHQYVEAFVTIDEKRFTAILSLLQKDGLIVQNRELITLA